MREEKDYVRDIAEMRAMMERSTRFLSLAGLAGVMAGIYALAGAFIAWQIFDFQPDRMVYPGIESADLPFSLWKIILLGLTVLILSIGTAVLLSYRKAARRSEKFWNHTTRRLLVNTSVPLVVGGLLILICIANGLIGLIVPLTLIFYGLSLFIAGKFTYEEMKSLGLIQMVLGLLSAYFVAYGLLFWALGFGVFHIIYGIYMHYRYER